MLKAMETVEATPEAKAAFTALAKVMKPQLRVVGLHDFIGMELPPRDTMMAPWLMTQSLNMIYGWRGVGKTHVNLGISYALACGSTFLNWKAEKPRRVLLVDGEMPAPALQERLAAIIASNGVEPGPGFLSIVTPDLQNGAMPDLSTHDGQEAISEVAERVNAELIVIDNLSCLVRGGGRENDAESWLSVSEWALLQRQAGRSILFIHHSGKNGQQRGTSKREDLLDVVISLRRPADYDPAAGACFEIHYEKARHLSGNDVDPIEAQLTVDSHGMSTWAWRPVADSTFDRVVTLANDGLSQSEIAIELELNRSTVLRAWRKADDAGLLETKTTTRGRNQYQKRSKGE
ncbi:AAA domain-containing protein [Nitrosospira briensis]|uniref:AAA domain-containing protein n=1 Tax=Nitrosospira briensis TaxID=35799 RepID=A0A1I4Y2M2_9PROT|nr:AAA family ATPase [Nitrosospira briensis]SFN32358.1 AAA domain-containing protein [Nitrosospira briensis]